VTPAQLAIDKERERAQCCRKHQTDRRGVFTKPRQGLAQTVPSFPENRPNHWKSCTEDSDDPRRGHYNTVQRCPDSRGTTVRAAPIDEAQQRHEKKRFRIAGNQKKGGWMGDNQQCAAKLERRRKTPAIAQEKEVSPETPGSELGGDEQGVASVDVKSAAKQGGNCRVRGEESNIGHFHHLVIDRRNDRLIAVVDDVHEPIAIVLDKGGIAIRSRPFRREQAHGHRELQQGQD
jgi:hypothetical protein